MSQDHLSAQPRAIRLRRRFDFIDFARGLAIILALVSHAILELRLSEDLGQGGLWLRCLTRTATPAFVLIFGIMLELVYFRASVERPFRLVARRLLQRSLLCYLAYLATIASEWLGGKASAREALDGALFLSGPAYGYILKFYTVALALAVPILYLRGRFGIAAPVLVLGGFWLLVPVLDFVAWDRAARLGEVTGLLFGRPRSPFSVLHGSVLIGIGMVIGWSLRRSQAKGRLRAFARTMGLFAGAALIGMACLFVAYSPSEILERQGALGDSFRSRQSIEYYVLALVSSLLLLAASFFLFRPDAEAGRATGTIFYLGRHSLLAFTLGNAFLNFMPREWGAVSTEGRLALIAAYLCAVPVSIWMCMSLRAFSGFSRLASR